MNVRAGAAAEFSSGAFFDGRLIVVPSFRAMRFISIRVMHSVALVGAALWLAGCSREEPLVVPSARPQTVEDVDRFKPAPIGLPVEGHPWIAHLCAVDLDRDGLVDVVVCDAQKNCVTWIRQRARGEFEETVLAADVPAPVHVEAVDMNRDGHLDLLVAEMGQIFPNNDKIGTVLILENDGRQRFKPHVVADHIARVSDVRAGDFNRDGLPDLAVGQFGYDQGEIRWMENLGDGGFRSHELLNLSGTIHVGVADFTGDGVPDIAALVSQQWEEIYLFANDGAGHFSKKILWGSTNEDYASSGMTVCDLNRDQRPDLLFTNGDGFGPTTQPGPRSWHGVQWLENTGNGGFRFHRIADLPGAFSPVGVDLDADGATDVVAVSAFNEWDKPNAVSLVWYRNDGRQNFTPHVLAYTPTHLLALAAADMDGSGKTRLISGAFFSNAPFDNLNRVLLWRPVGPATNGSVTK